MTPLQASLVLGSEGMEHVRDFPNYADVYLPYSGYYAEAAGCITVIIRGLNFCATVVPQKINPFAKTKD